MATTMPRSPGRIDSSDTFALDWKGLYQEHAPRLRRIAERRVGAGHAEDVVQDAFMRAFRNRASLDSTRPIGAWLSSITLYSSTDALRRRSARPEVLVDEEREPTCGGCTVEDEFENAVRRLGIEAAFDSLNHRQRRVLKRLEVDGWTQEQVAAVEQMSPEAVKSLAARARRTFREAYSSFAERMGVFGGAALGPAIWRLRARVQRLQGFAGEHVGAFGIAAATVTVVAIATVPSARPLPTRAAETSSNSVEASESTSRQTDSSDAAGDRVAEVQMPSPGTEAADGTSARVDAASTEGEPGSSTTEPVSTGTRLHQNGDHGEAMVTTTLDTDGRETETYAGIVVEDCNQRYTATVGCAAIKVASENGPTL